MFAAFLLACLTAIPAGIAMGVSRIARGIFDPPLEFYRPLPPLAYLPLIVIWFGIEETAKVVLIYLACFAPLAMAARAGVRSVTIEQINAAYSMGASKWQVIRHVVIPAAMPEILTGDAHRHRLRLDDARRGGNGGGDRGPRPDGAERVELPAHRRRDHGDRRDRRRRLSVRPADAPDRAEARALERPRIGCGGPESAVAGVSAPDRVERPFVGDRLTTSLPLATLPAMNQYPHFQKLVIRARQEAPLAAAFVYPCDRDSLQLALSGEFAGYLAPVLVGPQPRIRDLAAKAGLNVGRLSIVDTPDDPRAAGIARRRNGARRRGRRLDQGASVSKSCCRRSPRPTRGCAPQHDCPTPIF